MGADVLVTGASGMLGAQLARRLLEEGRRVRLLLRSPRHPLLDGLSLQEESGKLEREADVERAMRGCRTVFHVAGLVSYRRADVDALHRANVIGTRNVVQAALRCGVERLVHTSSTAAVGWSETPDRVLDEAGIGDDELRRIPYAWTKRLGEEEVLAGVREGLHAVIVNPGTIYGSGDVKRNTGGALLALKRGRLLLVPPGGQSVVAVQDAVSGHLLALERGTPGRRYILAAENVSFKELFERAARVLHVAPPRGALPPATEGIVRFVARVGEVVWPAGPLSLSACLMLYRYRYHEAARARRELDWHPAVTLEEAVADAMRFYAGGAVSVPG